MWLGYASEVEGRGRNADDLAFHRDAQAFRNVLLVEQPNGDFAQTILRQFLFDSYHLTQLDRLTQSDDPRVRDIAAKARKEVTYHQERSADLVIRLGDGSAESHRRMQAALDHHWRFVWEMTTGDESRSDRRVGRPRPAGDRDRHAHGSRRPPQALGRAKAGRCIRNISATCLP